MSLEHTDLQKTKGFQIAMSFKPFIDPKCAEHMEIVKDMARTINRHLNNETDSEFIYSKQDLVKAIKIARKTLPEMLSSDIVDILNIVKNLD